MRVEDCCYYRSVSTVLPGGEIGRKMTFPQPYFKSFATSTGCILLFTWSLDSVSVNAREIFLIVLAQRSHKPAGKHELRMRLADVPRGVYDQRA